MRSCGTGGDGGNARDFSAFTLIELLAVITILGIIAALAVPALKNLGKTNGQAGAARQLLDDVGRARQLAISQHTTVYMVFVPGQFWLPPYTGSSTWINSLSQFNYTNAVNLLDKQFTGYNFISLRSVGDQPGQSSPHYISEWKSLPDGSFIATDKFNLAYLPGNPPYYINDAATGVSYPINSFNYANIFFPTETNSTVSLPCIAFNYLGQLTVDGVNLASQDEYIPLAQGVVGYVVDANKVLQFAAPNATENPLGNSTNSMFDIIHIDRLTGRAEQLQQKVQ